MHIPSSTYRLQLNKDFTFRDVDDIIDYLEMLGISTIYAAPILQSTPGSVHGYDITDAHTINPEIGTLEELKKLSEKLREKGMFWLQDIVPNHMAFSSLNCRLMDVLERGRLSKYYTYFDILWNHPLEHLHEKLGVPFLGDELEECIRKKEIKLSFSAGGFTVDYFDTHYPLSVQAVMFLVSGDDTTLEEDCKALVRNAEAIRDVKTWNSYKHDWINQVLQNPEKEKRINEILTSVNDTPATLSAILDKQNYTLTYWQHTEKEINYRRFFTVNELICLRMEDEAVFQEYHSFLLSLYKENVIHGIRIDHIDGLQDPSHYIRNARKLFGNSLYMIAEKILEAKEDMPEHWPLEGTSGYEFLSDINQLLTDKKGSKQLLNFYKKLIPNLPPYKQLVYENKKLILEKYMQGEWDNLIQYFSELQLLHTFSRERLKQALGLIMLSLPVYRIYPESLPLTGQSHMRMQEAFNKAFEKGSEYNAEIDYIQSLLTQNPSDADHHDRILKFLKRLMQFTGPLTAKGVEDTTFYIYNPLISHDEVGDAPLSLSITAEQFHIRMQGRLKSSLLSLNATATHDTKRGEDARMRLNVLSELPNIWEHHVIQWLQINKRFHCNINNTTAPTLNDEYFIYQSIIGGFPEDFIVTEEWVGRVKEYLTKALREAKNNSNWTTPNTEYEEACHQFVEQILSNENEFLSSFIPFLKTICKASYIYSSAQALLKATAPGIPDTYQGCELFDLSFVDPDNRRPVNYAIRKQYLHQLIEKGKEGGTALFEFLYANREKGIEKLFVTWKCLNFRKQNNTIFLEGNYIPLSISGTQENAVAYARHFKDQWVLVAIPLSVALQEDADSDITNSHEQFIILPDNFPERCVNVFTREIVVTQSKLLLSDVFKGFPVALLSSGMDR